MARKRDQTQRQWILLRAIKRYPRMISTRELHQTLLDAGFDITVRSVQRDLEELSLDFPISDEQDGRTNLWFWSEDAPLLDIPGLDPHSALVFLMAERHLKDSLPVSSLKTLEPYFASARATLKDDSGTRYRHWSKKVRKLPRGPGLTVPQISPGILEGMESGLLHNRTIRLSYRRRGDNLVQTHDIDPRGLVIKDGLSYLVGTFGRQLPPYHFAAHRILSCEVLETDSPTLDTFDLDDYIHSVKAFDFPLDSKTLNLHLCITDSVRQHLEERPLADDQTISFDEESGYYIYSGQVADTSELRWWILAHGDQIEVLKPARLRTEIAEALESAYGQYCEDD